MTRCLVVGDVPAAVVALVESDGKTIARARLDNTPKVEGPYMILHVPAKPTSADICQLRDWLDLAADENVRAALTSGAGLTPEIPPLQWLQPAIYTMRLLNDGDHAVTEAVGHLLEKDVYQERPKDDDVPLGRWFDWTPDPVQYRIGRQLSLSSKTMEAFQRQLRTAVLAMQTPFPPAVRKLKQTPPWNPTGARTVTDHRKDKLPAGRPSLRDVFCRHDSPEARALLNPFLGQDVGKADWSVPKLLIRGESGSGKTLVAELVRDMIARGLGANRDDFPYITVNCAALTTNLLAHELFGAAPGQLTDIGEVVGQLAQAAYGVAFLDEIGDLELSAQRGLLVFLQDGIIRPFGIDPYPGFVRIIAATNRNVPLMIERQQFRNDLNARFDFQIEIPALREREESEREHLIDFAALNPQYNPGRSVDYISRNALDELSRREYSNGNFREMETTVHTAIAQARQRRSKCVRTKDLPDPAEPMAVRDSDAYVVEVVSAPTGAMIDAKGPGDIARAAAIAKTPILQVDDGEGHIIQHVVLRDYVLRHRSAKPNMKP